MANLLKNRFMISTIAFILLLAALLVLIIIPSFSEIKLINQQVLEERTHLEALYTRGQVLKSVQQNYVAIKDSSAFLNGIMLNENEELSYISTVETLADNIGIQLAISVGDAKRVPEQRFSELGFIFTATGDFAQLEHFLARLETLPYYTNIGEMTVAVREDGKNGIRTATITANATTYWLIPQR